MATLLASLRLGRACGCHGERKRTVESVAMRYNYVLEYLVHVLGASEEHVHLRMATPKNFPRRLPLSTPAQYTTEALVVAGSTG